MGKLGAEEQQATVFVRALSSPGRDEKHTLSGRLKAASVLNASSTRGLDFPCRDFFSSSCNLQQPGFLPPHYGEGLV